jgi:hypothetical protein
MAHLRAVGLLVLLSAVPAVAESVTIELTPQGMVWLWLHAADRAMAESLGTALGRSLGCTLSGVTDSASGGEWVFHAHCPGVFQRNGQVLEGQLKLGAFRQALTKASIREIRVRVIVPDAPYSRTAFPSAWRKASRNGLVHYSGTMAPRALPARAIHVAVGYRTSDLVLIFGPVPYTLLLTVLLLIRLNGAAKKAPQMDPRALWFAYPARPGVGNDGDLPAVGCAVGRDFRNVRRRHRSVGRVQRVAWRWCGERKDPGGLRLSVPDLAHDPAVGMVDAASIRHAARLAPPIAGHVEDVPAAGTRACRAGALDHRLVRCVDRQGLLARALVDWFRCDVRRGTSAWRYGTGRPSGRRRWNRASCTTGCTRWRHDVA